MRRDPGESRTWYERAARHGHSQAMNNLGVMYALGQGVQRSTIEAYAWFALSARTGNAEAENNRDLISKEFSTDDAIKAERRLAELATAADGVN